MKRLKWITWIVISVVAIQAWAKPFATRDSYEVIDSNYYPAQSVPPQPNQNARSEIQAAQAASTPMLLERLNTLQQEVYQLQGQLELQARDLQQMRQQQQDFYQAMEKQLAQLAQKETPATTTTVTADRNPTAKNLAKSHAVNPAAEQASYVAAYELVRNKNYPQAIKSMQKFIERYPDSQYAANAHYWLGELYLAEQQLKESITEFEIVLNQFPSSTKVAPAMLKLGYAYLGLGEDHKAKQQLQKVQQQFPGSHAARLAATRLKEMG